jgi:DNA-binding MarR family transcriptional regulator
MLPLTTKQAEFKALIARMTVGDVPPTYEALASAAGIVKSQVHYMLRRLKERGHVEFEFGRARTIRIVADDLPALETLSTSQLVRLRDKIDARLASKFAEPA